MREILITILEKGVLFNIVIIFLFHSAQVVEQHVVDLIRYLPSVGSRRNTGAGTELMST